MFGGFEEALQSRYVNSEAILLGENKQCFFSCCCTILFVAILAGDTIGEKHYFYKVILRLFHILCFRGLRDFFK